MTLVNLRNSIISILLLLAFALSCWSLLLSGKSESYHPYDRTKPDAFMENVVATFLNNEGNPTLKIASPKMIHYPNNTTDITEPRVTVFRKSPQPWYINSELAKANNGTEKITFIKNVVIHHPADIENPNTTMNTATLSIFPEKDIAETADAVTIIQPDVTVHAIGMLANLGLGTIKLLSQAKGIYAPHS